MVTSDEARVTRKVDAVVRQSTANRSHRMQAIRALAFGIAASLLVSCRSTTEPKAQRLGISTNDIGLTLDNPNPWPVYYLAINAGSLVVADYALCSNPASSCPRVPPRARVTLPFHDVIGYEPGTTEIVVTQWLLRRLPDGSYEPTNVSSTQVTVPRIT
jgi:hypothetical protein